MTFEIKVPAVGEAVQEAVLAQWLKRDGDRVQKDEVLFVIETDKVTLEVAAQAGGRLHILVAEGETVPIGAVVGTLDAETDAPTRGPERADRGSVREERPDAVERHASPAPKPEVVPEAAPAEAAPREKAAAGTGVGVAPSVRQLVEEKSVDLAEVTGTGPGGRVTRGDVLLYLEESGRAMQPEPARPAASSPEKARTPSQPAVRPSGAAQSPEAARAAAALPQEAAPGGAAEEPVTRKPMSRIRQRIAERLLLARQNTAMLTTFNEIDMSRVQAVRSRFKDRFREKYGVSLGIMSFFIKASLEALKEYPEVNAFIEGKEIVYHHSYHIGVAVGAERGLVVPVIRHADRLSFAGLERAIVEHVKKIQENRIELSDLEGGTFTISNGGVYGSLMSTPILNTPQSGILGMHKIEDRPVAVGGQVVIRPMMYVALSYDHRIIDGREAVGFLKRIKECMEDPERMLIEI